MDHGNAADAFVFVRGKAYTCPSLWQCIYACPCVNASAAAAAVAASPFKALGTLDQLHDWLQHIDFTN